MSAAWTDGAREILLRADLSERDISRLVLELEAEQGRLLGEALTARDVLRDARQLLEVWFSPWGAAKAARWEEATGDAPFTSEVCLRELAAKLGVEVKT